MSTVTVANPTSSSTNSSGGWLTGGQGQPITTAFGTGAPWSTTEHTLLGERLQVNNAVPFGDAQRASTLAPVWLVSQETLDFLRSEPGDRLQQKIRRLRDARMRGETVVRGIVTRNPRRPDPAPRPRRANLDDLQARVRGLITQIAELLDRGPIPDAQMGELSSMTARLQGEYDEVCSQLDEIDAQLAMARGLIIAYHTDSDEPAGT